MSTSRPVEVYDDVSVSTILGMPRRRTSSLDHTRLQKLLAKQDGVVSRRQVRECGGDDVDIRRLVRRRDLARVHEGVYVNHTGECTWRQRVWAAVLFYWPAAAHRESALTLHGVTRDRARVSTTVHVMVDTSRHVAALPGVEVERVRDARTWLTHHKWPPRSKVELSLLKVASGRDLQGAVAVLADAVQQRKTSVERLLKVIDQLVNLPQRGLLREVLLDVQSGAFSVLERRYLLHVERAHGLPEGSRQVRQVGAKSIAIRDVAYSDQRALVELDGRFGHSDAEDRWTDLDRDLAAATAEQLTVRLGWAQVLEPCRVAAAVASILTARGWTGLPHGCGDGCPLEGPGASRST